jgi:uncharacterized protein YutE (UPF0331/DUF86 family)
MIDRTRKYNVPKFDNLLELKILNKQEINELHKLRQIRNQLLHGVETPSDNYLIDISLKLKNITEKMINSIHDNNLKTNLQDEINKI